MPKPSPNNPYARIEKEILDRNGKLLLEEYLGTRKKTLQIWTIKGRTFIVVKYENGGYAMYKGTEHNEIEKDIQYLDELVNKK